MAEMQKKVLEHKHILAAMPKTCQDCGNLDKEYFDIRLEGEKRRRIVCKSCLLDSGNYEYKPEFLFIDNIDKRKVIKGSKGKTIDTSVYDIHSEYVSFC